MQSSYSNADVEILLKDITGLVEPLPAEVREKHIQHGVHYCEMLPLEYKPTQKYMAAYRDSLKNYSEATARSVCILGEKIYQKKGKNITLVSLARAGIPIGILLKRYIEKKHHIEVKHYAISIIRGRGIDRNAVRFILDRHRKDTIQFVDGWIGKGAILTQLKDALEDYPGIDTELGVLSDPANLSKLCGTHEDILIPSSCLNATVTGLISRTFLRDDVIGPDDFHGAAYYRELEPEDLSEEFLSEIEKHFDYNVSAAEPAIPGGMHGTEIVRKIAVRYGIADANFIKPGIGEATRVLLRRIPWKIIVNEKYADSEELKHIYQLASEKRVSCEMSAINLGNYKVCGIIKRLSDI